MAVLVFGGSGLVGSELVKFLLSKGLKIVVFYHENIGFLDCVKDDNLIFINSLKTPELNKYKITKIYHLASKQPSNNSSYNDFYGSNVELTINIIEFAKRITVDQFIYISTGSVYSKIQEGSVFNESSTANPLSYYGLTKYMAERLLYIEFYLDKTQVSIVRFPSIFGKNSTGGVVEDFYNCAINEKDIEVYSNGERYRNLIYIDSVVEMLYKVYLQQKALKKFEIFISGSSNSLKLFDIANLITNLTDSDSKIKRVSKFPPSDFNVFLDLSKAREILDFKPISIEDGIKKYINKMKNERI